jgi:hypothetical protein
VDVAAKDLQARLRVLFEQRRAREADENRVGGHERLHGAVQLAALGAVAFVHKDIEFAHGRAGLRLQFGDEGIEVGHVALAELVHQRAEQARRRLAKLAHQVAAAAGAVDGFPSGAEDPLNLLVQLVAVGDDEHARVGIVLQDPPRQQHHDDALAAALRVPNDAALAPAHVSLRRLDAEILVYARQLLDTAVEEHKVVHQLDDALLAEELEQVLVELEAAVVGLIFLPGEEVFFRRADGAVAQTLSVAPRQHKLHGGEEPGVEFGLLIGEILADAVANGDGTALEFKHADGDAVDVEHDVGPPLVAAAQRHLLGNGKVVLRRIVPIDEMHRLRDLAGLVLDRRTVAQQAVDGPVVAVEVAAAIIRLHL